jgi:hypothetical protein
MTDVNEFEGLASAIRDYLHKVMDGQCKGVEVIDDCSTTKYLTFSLHGFCVCSDGSRGPPENVKSIRLGGRSVSPLAI